VTQEHSAPGTVHSFGVSLLISATLVVPFFGLQLVTRGAAHEEFPFVLFLFMSLHSLLIVLLLTAPIRRLRVERSLSALGLGHWAGLILALFLVFVYVNVIIDQLPCFLGVPNCD
jgi:hypothetical protein